MAIDPATGEEEEDLSKVEWGAGLARLIRGQFPNLIFFFLGWSCLGLPCYLTTCWINESNSSGNIAFPIGLSLLFLVFCVVFFLLLRKNAWRAQKATQQLIIPTDVTDVNNSVSDTPILLSGVAKQVDMRWSTLLGFRVKSVGKEGVAELTALMVATVGFMGLGMAIGLTTFCAYDKKSVSDPPWEECYRIGNVEGAHVQLPPAYYSLLLIAVLLTLLGPINWFLFYKVVRQVIRPARQREKIDGLRELPQTAMWALAAMIGVIAGGGAWIFRQMIGLIHNVLFMQEAMWKNPFFYDANVHTPKPVNHIPPFLIIFSPVVGGLVVAFLVQNWAPEAKGHGVPEVMDAIHYKQGLIRPSVAGVKILASSFSIGSGGSVGREGPIIQIGSTFGSMVGVFTGCSISQRVTLIACGTAGGIAATFNTPIGGLVFAVELMLPASNSRTLMPLGTTAVVATYFGRWALGSHPAFDIPTLQLPDDSLENAASLLCFVPFGIVIGLFSVLFIKGIYWSEDFFESMPGNYYSRHSIGMLGQGLLIYMIMEAYGHYYVQGVGYATIRDVLSWQVPNVTANSELSDDSGSSDVISNPTFCMLLFFAKFISTNITIGSGASGGIFSPSLFLGATLGGVWGHIMSAIDPHKEIFPFNPVQACVAGMAGMIGGTTGASMTAIVMTFEMTRDYSTILPIIITTVLAHMTRKAISEDSIYTLKLVRRGHVVPEGLQAAVHAAQRVQDIMTDSFRIVGRRECIVGPYAGATLVLEQDRAEPQGSAAAAGQTIGAVCGPVPLDLVGFSGKETLVTEYVAALDSSASAFCVVGIGDDLQYAIRQMVALDAQVIVVSSNTSSLRASDVLGVVLPSTISRNLAAKSTLLARDRTLESSTSVSPLIAKSTV